MMAVAVQPDEDEFRAGTPEMLFQRPFRLGTQGRQYDVSPDGERFLTFDANIPGDRAEGLSVVLVENWFDELRRLVPTD